MSFEHEAAPVKSIGNSTTTPRDLVNGEDVAVIVHMLAESVSARLREHHFVGQVVELYVRDTELTSITRQKTLSAPTNITREIARAGMELFRCHYHWKRPIRSVGVRVTQLSMDDIPVQMNLFCDQRGRDRAHQLDVTVDDIRRRFGFYSIQRGVAYTDRGLSNLNAREDHVVHPRGYMERGNLTGA